MPMAYFGSWINGNTFGLLPKKSRRALALNVVRIEASPPLLRTWARRLLLASLVNGLLLLYAFVVASPNDVGVWREG